MNQYIFTMKDGNVFSFDSKYHITMLQPKMINGATFIYFEDSKHAINLVHVKELKVNGVIHHLRSYQV